MTDLFGTETKAAILDKDRTHRYVLMRVWDPSKPKVAFIGLNPSKGNEHKDDNTITKVKKIAAYNGFGGLYMFNLFSWISEHPEDLEDKEHSITNDMLLIEPHIYECSTVVFCWGAFKQAKDRAELMIYKFPDAMCLAKNADGSPKHPLYCLDKTKLIKF